MFSRLRQRFGSSEADELTLRARARVVTRRFDPGSEIERSCEVETRELSLAPTYDLERSEGRRLVRDYAARRILRIDEAAGQLRDDALLGVVHGRWAELQNRLHIHGVLEAGGAEVPACLRPAMSRHALAIALPDDNCRRDSSWKGRGARASAFIEGLCVVRARAEDEPLPAWARARLARSLRYTIGAHPQLLDRLARDAVPRSFEILHYDPSGTTSTSVELSACELVPVEPLALAGLTQVAAEGDPLWEQIHALRSGPPQDEASAQAAQSLIGAMIEREAYFEAFVAILEQSLSAPLNETLTKGFAGLHAISPEARLVMTAASASTPSEAAVNLPELEALASLAGDKAYVLEALIGNLQLMLGQLEAAEAAFMRALAGNPRMTGVYHDLGRVFAARFDLDGAYRCWDAGRWLSPTHPIHSDVDEHDRWLCSTYPEYFF